MLGAATAAVAACALAAPGASPEELAAGERAFQKCYSCHALEPDVDTLQGPSLHGIVGRHVAAVPRFDYSPALRRFAAANPRWTRALLDRMIADPEALVPGTAMSFHGISDSNERRALISYLETHASGAAGK